MDIDYTEFIHFHEINIVLFFMTSKVLNPNLQGPYNLPEMPDAGERKTQ